MFRLRAESKLLGGVPPLTGAPVLSSLEMCPVRRHPQKA
jgi:hypothetical protein